VTAGRLGRRGALSLAGAAALTGKAGAASPSEVKIAMIMPLSGPWARSGAMEQMGARMAVDDVNASGGIKSLGGAKLTMVEFDAGDSTEKAKDAAQRMLAQEPDLAGGFGGWLSSFVLAITEVTERAELPWLTQGYSDLITSRGFKYVFQSSPTGVQQAEATLPLIMELATKATGKKPLKIAAVSDNSAASVSFLKPIREHVARDLGVTLAVDEVYTPPLADATSIVQKLRSAKPDFVILGSTNVGDDKLLVDKFAEYGLTAQKMPLVGSGGHWCLPELLKLTTPDHVEGLIVELANWPGKAAQDVTERFMKRTGEPWFGHDSIFAYAHIRILAEAIDRAASTDRRKVNTMLHTMDLTSGPVAGLFPDGRVKYDEAGRRVGAQVCIVQFQNGRPVPVYPESVAVAKPIWPRSA
jgi:branched-chain amino acid transport system substrate-binding protein